ncbi:hypothetical protein GPA10_09500 [Streptomyces sp. p1417]|uniref:Transposase n=1 Tax=Streptomyces typhae TaxID=2681492 RepID=A0A6L6WRT3_9ACTN|nr:hypothetical protein [Streptomyces typhae]
MRRQAAHAIRSEADRRKLAGDQRTAADKSCQHRNNNADVVHYDRALAVGWPITDGVVEDAARHFTDRFDITGSRWSVPGAEALAILRAVISNGDLDSYWNYHCAPGTYTPLPPN